MISFTTEQLKQLLGHFSEQKILVIGDLMLDHYLWGDISRISPEAPVPVVDIESEEYKLGGAANVCYNVATLGATVIPIGVIGNDENGERLSEIFRESRMATEGLFIDSSRPTTIKSRVIARGQHMIRTDRETRSPLDESLNSQIIRFVSSHLNDIDGIIFEDYNKGLLSRHLIQTLIGLAKEHHIPVSVDPKFENFFDYEHVSLFKPNRKETMDRLGLVQMDGDALEKAGQKLMDRLHCDALLITLGDKGMALFEQGTPLVTIPTQAVKVHDVSGAGDTVIATMAVCLAAGANYKEAATIANQAAGIVCGQVGIVPIDKDELLKTLLRRFNS